MVISTPRGINVRLVVIRQLVSSERQDRRAPDAGPHSLDRVRP